MSSRNFWGDLNLPTFGPPTASSRGHNEERRHNTMASNPWSGVTFANCTFNFYNNSNSVQQNNPSFPPPVPTFQGFSNGEQIKREQIAQTAHISDPREVEMLCGSNAPQIIEISDDDEEVVIKKEKEDDLPSSPSRNEGFDVVDVVGSSDVNYSTVMTAEHVTTQAFQDLNPSTEEIIPKSPLADSRKTTDVDEEQDICSFENEAESVDETSVGVEFVQRTEIVTRSIVSTQRRDLRSVLRSSTQTKSNDSGTSCGYCSRRFRNSILMSIHKCSAMKVYVPRKAAPAKQKPAGSKKSGKKSESQAKQKQHGRVTRSKTESEGTMENTRAKKGDTDLLGFISESENEEHQKEVTQVEKPSDRKHPLRRSKLKSARRAQLQGEVRVMLNKADNLVTSSVPPSPSGSSPSPTQQQVPLEAPDEASCSAEPNTNGDNCPQSPVKKFAASEACDTVPPKTKKKRVRTAATTKRANLAKRKMGETEDDSGGKRAALTTTDSTEAPNDKRSAQTTELSPTTKKARQRRRASVTGVSVAKPPRERSTSEFVSTPDISDGLHVPRRIPSPESVKFRVVAGENNPAKKPDAGEKQRKRRKQTTTHHCTLCDKEFRSLSLLHQHKKTQLHKTISQMHQRVVRQAYASISAATVPALTPELMPNLASVEASDTGERHVFHEDTRFTHLLNAVESFRPEDVTGEPSDIGDQQHSREPVPEETLEELLDSIELQTSPNSARDSMRFELFVSSPLSPSPVPVNSYSQPQLEDIVQSSSTSDPLLTGSSVSCPTMPQLDNMETSMSPGGPATAAWSSPVCHEDAREVMTGSLLAELEPPSLFASALETVPSVSDASAVSTTLHGAFSSLEGGCTLMEL